MSNRTYGNWIKPDSGGIDYLNAAGTAVLFITPTVAIITQQILGFYASMVVGFLGVIVLFSVVVRNKYGLTILEQLVTLAIYTYYKIKKYNLYRSGPLSKMKNKFKLPGLLAQTKLITHQNYGVIINDYLSSYTVIFKGEPDGLALVDEQTHDNWVANYANLLNLGSQHQVISAMQVTIESIPDNGTKLKQELKHTKDANIQNEKINLFYQQVQSQYSTGVNTTNAYIAISFSPTKFMRKNKHETMLDEISLKLPQIYQVLSHCGIGGVELMTQEQIATMVNCAFDPQMHTYQDQAQLQGKKVKIPWEQTGPVTAKNHYKYYSHDSAISQTYCMVTPPEEIVQSDILAALVSSHNAIPLKRVTMCYKPIQNSDKERLLKKENIRIGKRIMNRFRIVHDSKLYKNQANILSLSNETATGATLCDFTMFVTVTCYKTQDLQQLAAITEGLSSVSKILLRPCYGFQDSAFQACLPLGVFLDKYNSLPEIISTKL